MSYAYKVNEDVRHLRQGPQFVQLMRIEADGRPRCIKSKSENIERVVTEDQLSYSQ